MFINSIVRRAAATLLAAGLVLGLAGSASATGGSHLCYRVGGDPKKPEKLTGVDKTKTGSKKDGYSITVTCNYSGGTTESKDFSCDPGEEMNVSQHGSDNKYITVTCE